MRRLIYADEAIEYVNDIITVHRFYHPRSTTENFPISEVIAKINEVPTADATPVVHAKLLNPNPYGLCSNCNNLIDIRDGFNYCPKCGAMLKTDEVTE